MATVSLGYCERWETSRTERSPDDWFADETRDGRDPERVVAEIVPAGSMNWEEAILGGNPWWKLKAKLEAGLEVNSSCKGRMVVWGVELVVILEGGMVTEVSKVLGLI